MGRESHRPAPLSRRRAAGRRRTRIGPAVAVLAALIVVACDPSATASPAVTASPEPSAGESVAPSPTVAADPADVVFRGGPILTLADGLPRVAALAIRDDRIVAIGDEADVLAWAGPETAIVDLAGRTLMPGFVDAHSHVLNDYFGPAALGRELTLAERQDVLLEHGITTHGSLFVKPALLDELHAFDAAGDLVVRVSAYLAYDDACAAIRPFPDPDIPDPFWWEGVPPTREFGEHLRIGGVKVFADGANCGIPPAFSFPLVVGAEPGTPFLDETALTEVLQRASAAGHQVAIHATGDAAIDLALDSIETALDGGPNDLRHRIEHSAVMRLWDVPTGPRQVERYGGLGIVATVFADWPSCTPFAAQVEPEFAAWEWPYRELVDANPGLHVAWSGDAPTFDVDPLHQLFGFVTRHDVAADGTTCPPPPDKADGTFSVEEALRMMTTESAYALFRETEVGMLAPGMLADLVVLSGDPTAVEPMDLAGLSVRMTMIDGLVRWCADPAEGVCPAVGDGPAATPTPEPSGGGGGGGGLPAGWTATASASLAGSPPERAFDGDEETIWSAGSHPVQWLEVGFDGPRDLGSVELVVSQYPAGPTVHVVTGRHADGTEEALATFADATEDGQVLSVLPLQPWTDIVAVRIETTESPSWVAWREVRLAVD